MTLARCLISLGSQQMILPSQCRTLKISSRCQFPKTPLQHPCPEMLSPSQWVKASPMLSLALWLRRPETALSKSKQVWLSQTHHQLQVSVAMWRRVSRGETLSFARPDTMGTY